MMKIRALFAKRQMLQLAMVTLLLGLCTTAGLYAYHRYLRNLRVAVIGWHDSDWAAWREVAAEAGYTLHRFDPDDISRTPLGNYHAVLIRVPGYRPDDGDRAVFAAARAAGTRLVMLPPSNDIAAAEDNLEPEHREVISDFLRHGGLANVRGLLNYLARELAGRDVEVPPVVERPQEGFFHLGETVFAAGCIRLGSRPVALQHAGPSARRGLRPGRRVPL